MDRNLSSLFKINFVKTIQCALCIQGQEVNLTNLLAFSVVMLTSLTTDWTDIFFLTESCWYKKERPYKFGGNSFDIPCCTLTENSSLLSLPRLKQNFGSVRVLVTTYFDGIKAALLQSHYDRTRNICPKILELFILFMRWNNKSSELTKVHSFLKQFLHDQTDMRCRTWSSSTEKTPFKK